MKTDELALDYMDRAELTLEEARSAFENLARKRGPAFYGIERSLTPASKIFGREEGLRACLNIHSGQDNRMNRINFHPVDPVNPV